MRFVVSFLSLVLFCTAVGSAQEQQKSEIGFLLGGTQIPGGSTSTGLPLNSGSSIAFSVNYARHLTGRKTELQLEIPFEADPSHKIDSAQRGAISSLAGLYVTPSLRVRFLNGQRISPWLSSGFGYGLYEGSKALNNGATNPDRFLNTPTAQFGGGVDFRTPIRIVFPISLRIEARDYYTLNAPNFGVGVRQGSQNNVVAAGGFVIHF